MAEDSLLSQLCNICHINTPKYRCPRCSVRTCSLPCTQKHKTWSSCTGVRDPAAYLPRAQLETAASFDRDFNFITGIERTLERAEREAENRGIELEHEYMVKRSSAGKKGQHGGKKRRRGEATTTTTNTTNAPRLVKGELGFVRAAEEAGVRLVRAPVGLSRRKMNHSRIHPKHKCLSWSVEWIIPATGQTLVRPCLETIPLKEVYDRVFPASKEKDGFGNDSNVITTNTDQQDRDDATVTEAAENKMVRPHRNVYFYLRRHRTATRDIVLVPLLPSSILRDVLRGRSVFEFPTIYVLQVDLRRRQVEEDTATISNSSSSTMLNNGGFILEEDYLKDHLDEAENEQSGENSEDDEEDDYTSSEGSSSEESDDNEDDDDDDEIDEIDPEEESGDHQSNEAEIHVNTLPSLDQSELPVHLNDRIAGSGQEA